MRTLSAFCGLLTLSITAAAQGRYGPTPVPLPQSALDGRLKVPESFKVATFAQVPNARWMALGPDGAVYVGQSRTGQIARLFDADGDGKPEPVFYNGYRGGVEIVGPTEALPGLVGQDSGQTILRSQF